MTPDLPTPIKSFFDANQTFDIDAMLAPFDDEALVHDEHNDHRGKDDIRAWMENAILGAKVVNTPLSAASECDRHRVAVNVAGEFKGSPITLTFDFRLTDHSIAELAIG